MQLKQSLDEIQSYQSVAGAYRQLKIAFAHEEKVKQLNTEMEMEEKRIMMVHRNPEIARIKYPFKKRMGVEGFFNGRPDTNGKKHVKIDDKFLMQAMNPQDKRVKQSLAYLEHNNFQVDFKKIRSTFEGVMWKNEVKEQINMQRFLSEKLKKENLVMKSKIKSSNRKGKVTLIN